MLIFKAFISLTYCFVRTNTHNSHNIQKFNIYLAWVLVKRFILNLVNTRTHRFWSEQRNMNQSWKECQNMWIFTIIIAETLQTNELNDVILVLCTAHTFPICAIDFMWKSKCTAMNQHACSQALRCVLCVCYVVQHKIALTYAHRC